MPSDTTWLDEVYSGYDAWKEWSPVLKSAQERRLIDMELRRAAVSPPARVLEIGFGTGALLRYLASLGYACSGIERSGEHDAELARAGLTIHHGELGDLPEAQFDLIIAMDVLEHLEKPDILAMLRKIRMLLKPGGRLLARFPNGASPFGAMNQSADLTHLTSLSIAAFDQACGVAGLHFVGGWNSAVSLRGEGLKRSLVKPLALGGRRLFEILIGAMYFGERRPLDANVTVCAERHR